jgi:hypothetical protein
LVSQKYADDLGAVLARRRDNGGRYWDSGDGRIGVGGPFSTLESLLILHELRVPRTHEAVKGALSQVLAAGRDDGRYRVTTGAIYPCHTAYAARILCRFGYARDRRMRRTFAHLLDSQHDDGGWRCNTVRLGRSPDTDASNPGVTLHALDAFRFTASRNSESALDRAVGSLLNHWVARRPLGPCRFGIGSLFMQVEYPFLRYNLFYYVYVLSFFDRARADERYREAFAALSAKLDPRRHVVVERTNPKLAKLTFCAKGRPSELATRRYREILKNHAD